MDSVASDPDVKVNDVTIGTGSGSAGVVGLGPGLAYYFDPSNAFIGATLLFSQLVINNSDGNKIGESDWGVTVEGTVGKEWWVSDNWGLGLSGQLMAGAMKDKDTLGTGAESSDLEGGGAVDPVLGHLQLTAASRPAARLPPACPPPSFGSSGLPAPRKDHPDMASPPLCR